MLENALVVCNWGHKINERIKGALCGVHRRQQVSVRLRKDPA